MAVHNVLKRPSMPNQLECRHTRGVATTTKISPFCLQSVSASMSTRTPSPTRPSGTGENGGRGDGRFVGVAETGAPRGVQTLGQGVGNLIVTPSGLIPSCINSGPTQVVVVAGCGV